MCFYFCRAACSCLYAINKKNAHVRIVQRVRHLLHDPWNHIETRRYVFLFLRNPGGACDGASPKAARDATDGCPARDKKGSGRVGSSRRWEHCHGDCEREQCLVVLCASTARPRPPPLGCTVRSSTVECVYLGLFRGHKGTRLDWRYHRVSPCVVGLVVKPCGIMKLCCHSEHFFCVGVRSLSG